MFFMPLRLDRWWCWCGNAGGCFTDIMLYSSMCYHQRHALPIATDPPVALGSQVEGACGAVIFCLHGVRMNTKNLAQQVIIFDLVVPVGKKY